MRKIALFDKPLAYFFNKTKDGFSAHFKTSKGQTGEVSVEIEYQDTKWTSKDSVAHGGLVRLDPPPLEMNIFFWIDKKMDMTGGGGQIEVFSTVTKVVLQSFDLVRAKEDGAIWVKFEASEGEEGRIKLYAKLAQGLARWRGGEFKGAKWSSLGGYEYHVVFPAKREVEQIPINFEYLHSPERPRWV